MLYYVLYNVLSSFDLAFILMREMALRLGLLGNFISEPMKDQTGNPDSFRFKYEPGPLLHVIALTASCSCVSLK